MISMTRSKRDTDGFTLIELMIVVAIIGILAAVAVPTFLHYLRRAKASEVHSNLDGCYRAVVDYFDRPLAIANGAVSSALMPAPTAEACPNGATAPSGLSGFLAANAPGGDFGWIITEAVYGCYQLLGTTANGMASNFNCQARTDIDGDNSTAIWIKAATYHATAPTFSAGHVWHSNSSDDW